MYLGAQGSWRRPLEVLDDEWGDWGKCRVRRSGSGPGGKGEGERGGGEGDVT